MDFKEKIVNIKTQYQKEFLTIGLFHQNAVLNKKAIWNVSPLISLALNFGWLQIALTFSPLQNNNPITFQTQKLTPVYLQFPNYMEEIVQALNKVMSVFNMSK